MTWTRLSDDFTDRPEMVRPGRSARYLHIEALVWCNRLLTDGVLPDHMVCRVTDSDDVARDVAELAAAGKWTRLVSDDGWQIDWSDQETAEVVRDRKDDNAERQRRYNERRRRHATGDHSICDPRFCRNASRDASEDASLTASRPVPSRPDPKGGTGTGDREVGSATSDGSAPLAASSAAPPPEPPWAGAPPPGATPAVTVTDGRTGKPLKW